jgi:hypothetical protein
MTVPREIIECRFEGPENSVILHKVVSWLPIETDVIGTTPHEWCEHRASARAVFRLAAIALTLCA